MGISQQNIQDVDIKLAQSEAEIEASQRLRYKVFYEEYAATPSPEMARERRDMDDYDAVSDHLIVLDKSISDPIDRIVGTYRLLRNDVAKKHGSFYTSDEYDIAPLINSGTTLLELGRSCVLADYRTRPVMQLLWQGIVEYMQNHDLGLMFGCASLYGTDISALAKPLSYLHHYHLAPESLRPRAVEHRYVDMNIFPPEDFNAKEQFKALPPLIKGYLRVGCTIGEGAVIDHQFNTTDVCIVLPMEKVAARYRNHYTRKINRRQRDAEQNNDHNVEATGTVVAQGSA